MYESFFGIMVDPVDGHCCLGGLPSSVERLAIAAAHCKDR